MQESQMNGQQQSAELEVFVSGGNYSYKKASLDICKLTETAEGVIMVRANVQVEMGSQYTVFVPKKLI